MNSLAKNCYSLVVRAKLNDENSIEESYQFDNVDDSTVNLSSEITAHPMVNGDVVADHMFNQPATINVSGSFSLYGNKRTDYKGLSRLYEIQKVFEKIKSQGVFCTLVYQNQLSLDETRFQVRKNMVLNSISWTQKQASLGFQFGFAEVQTVDIEEVAYEVDVTDVNLPTVTDTITLDFTETLLDFSKVDTYIIDTLNSTGLMTSDFLQYTLKTIAAGAIVATVTTVAVGVAALITISSICGGVVAAFPVGTIVAGAIAAATFLVIGVASIIKGIKKGVAARKYKIDAFKYYPKNEAKSQAEVQRLAEYIGKIHENFESLEKVMEVYGISSNKPQELTTYIDNHYYIFTFTKNNMNENYNLVVTDMNNNNFEEFNKPNITEFAKNSVSECKSTNDSCLFTTENGYYVYLVNLKLSAAIEAGSTKEELEALQLDLTNYAVFVSQINLDDFNTLLEKIVINTMTM